VIQVLTSIAVSVVSFTIRRSRKLCPTIGAIALVVGAQVAHAQEFFQAISEHQERYAALEANYNASLARIISSAETFQAQEHAYELLDNVAHRLGSTNREFDVLNVTMELARMVTDRDSKARADRFVDLQLNYMDGVTLNYIQYVDKALTRSTDQETTRLLVEARDLFRSSSDLLDRIEHAQVEKE